jgi:hypothetical protein
MITADTLKTLTTLGPGDLSRALAVSGFTGVGFSRAEFLGITNGGDFCYKAFYHDDAGLDAEMGETWDKVFVSYSVGDHSIRATM